MRAFLVIAILVVGVAVGLWVPLPSFATQEAFLPSQPTAAPLADVGPSLAPLPEVLETPPIEVVMPSENDLVFDETQASGIYDAFGGVLLDIEGRKWNGAPYDPVPVRPEAPEGEAISTLALESGLLVLRPGNPSALELHPPEGEAAVFYIAEQPDDAVLLPLANPDMAYISQQGAILLIDAASGKTESVAALGRPVWHEAGEYLLLERDGEYILHFPRDGSEEVYRLFRGA